MELIVVLQQIVAVLLRKTVMMEVDYSLLNCEGGDEDGRGQIAAAANANVPRCNSN